MIEFFTHYETTINVLGIFFMTLSFFLNDKKKSTHILCATSYSLLMFNVLINCLVKGF